MAFEDFELSHDSGEVVELYSFSTQSRSWHYCTRSADVNAMGTTFVPANIGRDRVERSSNLLKSDLKIQLAYDSELAIEAMATAPEEILLVSVWQAHMGDLADPRLVFKGRFIAHEINNNIMDMVFEPIATMMNRLGFQAKYQRSCRHIHYGAHCRVDPGLYSIQAVVASVNKNSLTAVEVGEWPDGYFSAGYIIGPDGNRRMVIKHDSYTLDLIRPMTALKVGDVITVFAGCNHTMATCRDKFDNLLNYGGFDYIPMVNPFAGKQIF